MNKKLIRLTEGDLHRLVKESVNKIINEAQIGRGTTTTISSSDYADDYHDHTTYHFNTSENPYSNDSVQMLADRFEKRLGGEYKVSAFNNPIMKKDEDSDSNATTTANIVDFKVTTPNSRYSNVQDIMYIAKVANQLFSNMHGERYFKQTFGDSKVNISDIENDGKGCDTQSITISVELYINEPRKDMIPRSKYQRDHKTPTGFEYSNFTKPQYWSHTEY